MTAVRIGFGLFGAFWGIWAVAALEVAEHLDVSEAGLGLLVAATVGGTVVANAVGGTMTERLGVGRALVVGAVGYAAGTGLLAAVPGRLAWMAAFLVAVATAGMLDVVLTIASTGALADRPGRLLRVHATYNLGALAGAALTGVLLAAGWSWRWSYLTAAAGSAALAAGAARRPRHGTAHTAGRAPARLRDAAGELRASRLVPLAAMLLLGAVVEGGAGTFGVLYLRDDLGVAVLAGAGAYSIGQGLAFVTRLVIGADRVERWVGGAGESVHRPTAPALLARVGLALGGVGLAVEVAGGPAWLAAVGLALAWVGIAVYWPLLSAVASRSAARPALAVGGTSAVGYLGFLVGPPLVGLVADAGGLRAGVLTLAVAAAVAASLSLRRIGAPAVTVAYAAENERR